MRTLLLALGFAFSLSAPAPAFAAEVEWGGFFTMGYARSNITNQFLRQINKDGNFSRISNGGLLASAALSERFSVKLQTVASGWPDKSFHFDLDLAQGRYLLSENFDLLFGRVRLPLFMISDYRMVGALYPWAIPPVEVYELLPLESVGSNETFNGVNLLFKHKLLAGWQLNSEWYGGGSNRTLTPPNETIEATAKRLFGAAISLSKESFTWRASYLNSLNRATTTQVSSGNASQTDSSLGKLQLLGTGIRWEPSDWLFLSELIRVLGENRRFQRVTSYYGSAGYYLFHRRVLAIGTVAGITKGSKSTEQLAQTSATFGLNFMPEASLVFKLQGQRIFPHPTTSGVAPPPAPGAPPTPAQGSGLFSTAQRTALTVLYATVSAAF